MHITVVEQPRSVLLTTVDAVIADLRLVNVSSDTWSLLETLVTDASDAISRSCQREFARASVTQKTVGYGRNILIVDRTPLMATSEVRYRDAAINGSGYSVYDAEAGFLWRDDGWTQSEVMTPWLTAEIRPSQPGRLDWAVDYIGGYLMPADDLVCSGTLSANALDNSFNHADDDFPLVITGEYIRVTGMPTSANNGRHRVISRTVSKIVVGSTLTTETASGIARLYTRNLPPDLERLCKMTIKDWWFTLTRDMTMTAESIGDWSAQYASAPFLAKDNYGLPPVVVAGLRRWTRVE